MQFSKAIVRKPGENFSKGVTEAELGAPDLNLALAQHEQYCETLQSCGVDLISLEADPLYPDCCFVEDTAIVAGDAFVATRMGHPSRRGEVWTVSDALSRYKKMEFILEPGTVDGGDVMRVGSHYFIGVSKRTNKEGAIQLVEILKRYLMTASIVAVDRFIHLKTAVSAVNEHCIMGLAELVSDKQFDAVPHKILVPPDEHWAANCLSVNGNVLVPSECPKTVKTLESMGLKVRVVDTSEFQKMDGRLTCLSVLF